MSRGAERIHLPRTDIELFQDTELYFVDVPRQCPKTWTLCNNFGTLVDIYLTPYLLHHDFKEKGITERGPQSGWFKGSLGLPSTPKLYEVAHNYMHFKNLRFFVVLFFDNLSFSTCYFISFKLLKRFFLNLWRRWIVFKILLSYAIFFALSS